MAMRRMRFAGRCCTTAAVTKTRRGWARARAAGALCGWAGDACTPKPPEAAEGLLLLLRRRPAPEEPCGRA